jgi:hypothetical protein
VASPARSPETQVANWGRCNTCQQLAVILDGTSMCEECVDRMLDQCRREVQQEAIEKIACHGEIPDDEYQQAVWLLRPEGVLVNRDSDARIAKRAARLHVDLADYASLPVPETALPSDRLVARAIARIASKRLQAGWSLQYALRSAALGSRQVHAELTDAGHKLDLGTVKNALKRLSNTVTLDRVGQLDDWCDAKAEHRTVRSSKGTVYVEDPVEKSGAYLYTLNVIYRQLGDIAAFARATLRPNVGAWVNCSPTRRVQTWCAGLIRNARQGNRNSGGYLLACRCITAGLTDVQTEHHMKVYQEAVRDLGRHEYSWQDARATLRSVCRYRDRIILYWAARRAVL